MAHGLKVYRSDGSVLVDTTHKLTRLAYTNSVAAGASGSALVAGLIAARAVGFANVRSVSGIAAPHAVTVSDGSVSWAPPASGTSADSDVFVFMFK